MVILECQNLKVWKSGFDHPKRCGRFGGPWETGFRAEIPNFLKEKLRLLIQAQIAVEGHAF